MSPDGSMRQFNLPSHENATQQNVVDLEPGTYVFSDTLKKGDKTFAEIANDYRKERIKYEKDLYSSDYLRKQTAKTNINSIDKKTKELAMENEAMKNMKMARDGYYETNPPGSIGTDIGDIYKDINPNVGFGSVDNPFSTMTLSDFVPRFTFGSPIENHFRMTNGLQSNMTADDFTIKSRNPSQPNTGSSQSVTYPGRSNVSINQESPVTMPEIGSMDRVEVPGITDPLTEPTLPTKLKRYDGTMPSEDMSSNNFDAMKLLPYAQFIPRAIHAFQPIDNPQLEGVKERQLEKVNNRNELRDIQSGVQQGIDTMGSNYSPVSRAAKLAMRGKGLDATNQSYANMNRINAGIENQEQMMGARSDMYNSNIKNTMANNQAMAEANQRGSIDSLFSDMGDTVLKQNLEKSMMDRDLTSIQMIAQSLITSPQVFDDFVKILKDAGFDEDEIAYATNKVNYK